MRYLALFLLGFVGVAFPQSSVDRVRRVDYGRDKFSITVPVAWHEIDSAVLANMSTAVHQAAPNAPEIKISYGFTSSIGTTVGYPWVAIMVTTDQVDARSFEKMDWAYRSVDELTKKWQDPTSGGTLQKAQMKSMVYDKARHLLWGVSQSTFSGIGSLQTLSAAYFTRVGTIQVHCYSKASEFAQDQPVCRGILDSVVIDSKIAILSPTR